MGTGDGIVTLTSLRDIGGTLDVGGLLTGFSMPGVSSLGGAWHFTDVHYLKDIDVPILETVGGDFELVGSQIATLSGLPALRAIRGNVRIVNNQILPLQAVYDWLGRIDVSGSVLICEHNLVRESCQH